MGEKQHSAEVEDWQSMVASKQKSCLEKIPKDWLLPTSVLEALQTPLESHPNRLIDMDIPRRSGVMSERELDITENHTVGGLLQNLRSGAMTSLEVTVAFSKRAVLAQQLISCLTETYFEEAKERAIYLDKLRVEEGRLAGPLHGLPISLKDAFQITGSEASIGFVSFLGRVSEENSPLVDILSNQLGAVIYVKTNIPQTLMTTDSHNNIFGRTLNPYNTALGAGGSSGGEGALVAFRGSPLGVGTDVAGSIRIPALCCGTYGFKPSSNRIPYGGLVSPTRPGGVDSLFPSCAGPIANDLEALRILSQSVIEARPASLDSTALDIPWREISGQAKQEMRIGLVSEDPRYPLHPPVRRALNEAARLLRARGHEVIAIPAAEARVSDAVEVASGFFGLDPSVFDHIRASEEPLVPSVTKIQQVASSILNTYVTDIADLEGIPKIAALNMKRLEIAEAWRRIWIEYQIDAVISPPSQNTAVPHDQYGLPPYTAFLNVLDYPACVIPFGRASKELDPEPLVMGPDQHGPDSEWYFLKLLTTLRAKQIHGCRADLDVWEDEPDTVDGALTSIQVFTSQLRDEECLQAAGVIDKCLRQYRDKVVAR